MFVSSVIQVFAWEWARHRADSVQHQESPLGVELADRACSAAQNRARVSGRRPGAGVQRPVLLQDFAPGCVSSRALRMRALSHSSRLTGRRSCRTRRHPQYLNAAMNAPISKRQVRSLDTASSQIVVRRRTGEARPPTPEAQPPRQRSRLPTFVQGRVLVGKLFVEEVFEVTPQSTFVRAYDLELDRVALVRLRPRSDSEPNRAGRSWFQRLDHPLASADILGTSAVGGLRDGWPLLVSQYWHGRSLEAFLRSGEAPDLLRVACIASQVARALDGAHRLGQAHGDLRSDDVWLSRRPDGQERAMLIGFQPGADSKSCAALQARDLNALGDLLSLLIASLLPRYRFVTRTAASGCGARDGGTLVAILEVLTCISAGASVGGHYRSMAEAARALAQVESMLIDLSAHP